MIEMFPGLALLQEKRGEDYRFVQECPQARSEELVETLVSRWSALVMGKDVLDKDNNQVSEYLGPPEIFLFYRPLGVELVSSFI